MTTAIYYISSVLIVLGLPALLAYFVVALVKPGILQKHIGQFWSRKRIAGVGVSVLLGSTIALGSIVGATIPESVKAERTAAQQVVDKEKTEKLRLESERIKKESEAAEISKKPVIKTEKVTSAVSYSSSEQESATMTKGQRITSTQGVDGEKTETYEVTYIEGKQTDKKLIGSEITKEPVHEIVSVGTYVAPQPVAPAPAPSSSVGSAYYQNCKAARAAGVTPIYAGEPGYRSALDRDGDGVACE